jgi:hypothetical protein
MNFCIFWYAFNFDDIFFIDSTKEYLKTWKLKFQNSTCKWQKIFFQKIAKIKTFNAYKIYAKSVYLAKSKLN